MAFLYQANENRYNKPSDSDKSTEGENGPKSHYRSHGSWSTEAISKKTAFM